MKTFGWLTQASPSQRARGGAATSRSRRSITAAEVLVPRDFTEDKTRGTVKGLADWFKTFCELTINTTAAKTKAA